MIEQLLQIIMLVKYFIKNLYYLNFPGKIVVLTPRKATFFFFSTHFFKLYQKHLSEQ